jgi:nitrite reductase (NADH) large subunit
MNDTRPTVIVVGHGMVGHRFCEKMVELDRDRRWRIVTFCEEPRAAYDRVGLTQFFAHRDATKLVIANLDWYAQNDIDVRVGDRAARIERKRRIVRSERGGEIAYDKVVLATGSYPFVPPMPGTDLTGVFLYRTIEDLERIAAYAEKSKRAAVLGGGLLGLEAAKAVVDLGLEAHVVEFAPRLMPRQLDEAGGRLLLQEIRKLGVHVHLGAATKAILGTKEVEGIELEGEGRLDVDLVIVSCGIRPRDELARECGLAVGERGGIVVDDRLETSDPEILAIGEVALHRKTVYGLVAPGYEMAEIAAANLTGGDRTFTGGDLSAKLKLMGVDVASFGDHEAPPERARPLVFDDPFGGIYRKLLVSPDGKRLLGGVLVGEASDYATLASLARSGADLPVEPGAFLSVGTAATPLSAASLGDAMQVCSCNAVTKGAICSAIRDGELATVEAVKSATKAGTGCGGCLPLVTDLFKAEMKAAGRAVVNHLCEHFSCSRQELFQIVKLKGYRTFDELVAAHGRGNGCEICKPAVASIFASLWNEPVLDHVTLQDTNDHFLANLQRGGLYSVIPRIPGGEITPEKLVVLGRVAEKYALYVKITGGQRIDLLGAQAHQLPDIWEELVAAGFESGHAYGKAMRTVKSCVGTTWCRYGVGDSVGFAIRVEERYKGVRAPHKLKSAVSGCTRECAEAQSKDFGLIATEKGWNLYVCGNGGMKPRHADLLASDLDEDTAIRLIDRFLAYYIETADRLTRTSVWLEKMEGGIDRLREIVVDDALGIASELERRMQHLVDTYACEWAEVVKSPERRKWFKQFVNSDATERGIEVVDERGQKRPADWPKNGALPPASEIIAKAAPRWVKVGRTDDFPHDGGRTILHGKTQIAVFRFESRGEWYATQNVCPHKRALVLSQGILGDADGTPKVACPLHKKPFALTDGKCLSGEPLALATFPVRVEDEDVWVELPPEPVLDAALATDVVRVSAETAHAEA